MVVKSQEVEILKDAEDTVYQFSRKAGRLITKRKPVFSPDKKSLLVIVENVVRVYNVQTGDLVRTLETEKHTDKLIAIDFPDYENYNLYGCSENGCVTSWSYETGGVIREVDLELEENQKVYSFDLLENNEAFLTIARDHDKCFSFASFNMKTGQVAIKYKGFPVGKTSILCVSLGYCDGDRYAAVCNGTKCLFVQNLVQPHLKLQFFNSNHMRIISVAAHPKDSAVAITDTLGRVTIVKGYLYNQRNLAREVMHWHYLPVFASAFSKEGSYLYTGGMEKVLVKWSVGNIASKAQEKQFIVRLPGYVRHVAVSDTLVALALTNNSVIIASTQMKVATTISECGGLSPAARALGGALVYHAPSDSLMLGGRAGHLQLYSTASDKLLYNLDIAESNSLPPTRQNLIPLELEIACAATSGDGAWLVTSEFRDDRVLYPEERLKFWIRQSSGDAPFKLHTCVNLSHGGCQVVSLALSNNGDFCVSSGKDHKFRIWKLDTSKEGNDTVYSWSCLTACYYSSGFAHSTAQEALNGFKNNEFNKAGRTDELVYLTQDCKYDDVVKNAMDINANAHFVDKHKELYGEESEMGEVAISQDGSLTAAWCGGKLTVWDTHAGALRTSLAHPLLRARSRHVHFGNHDAAHYLVCTTEDCLAVWSLLSLTVKWFVNLRPACLAADPYSNKMAVITDTNHLVVFSPHSAAPLLRRGPLAPPRAGLLAHCAFAPAPPRHVRLYMMRNDCEIFALEPAQQYAGPLEAPAGRAAAGAAGAGAGAGGFGALVAQRARSEVQRAEFSAAHYLDADGLGKSAMKQFLSSAAHMIPPVRLFSTAFLEHLSGKKPAPEGNELQKQEKMEVDNPTSDEDDETTERVETKRTELWAANYEQVDESRLKKIVRRDASKAILTLLFKQKFRPRSCRRKSVVEKTDGELDSNKSLSC